MSAYCGAARHQSPASSPMYGVRRERGAPAARRGRRASAGTRARSAGSGVRRRPGRLEVGADRLVLGDQRLRTGSRYRHRGGRDRPVKARWLITSGPVVVTAEPARRTRRGTEVEVDGPGRRACWSCARVDRSSLATAMTPRRAQRRAAENGHPSASGEVEPRSFGPFAGDPDQASAGSPARRAAVRARRRRSSRTDEKPLRPPTLRTKSSGEGELGPPTPSTAPTPRRAASRPRGSPRPRVDCAASSPFGAPARRRSRGRARPRSSRRRRRSRSPRARPAAAPRSRPRYAAAGTFSVGSISIVAVPLEAGRRRDQLADDHVLLEAEQAVDLALDRRVGQHLRRLLEGGRREERLGRERRLRDPEDQRLEGRLLLSSPS